MQRCLRGLTQSRCDPVFWSSHRSCCGTHWRSNHPGCRCPRGVVIASAGNRVKTSGSSIKHVELETLKYVSSVYGRYLPDLVLYSTHEPCATCAGACVWCRIGAVIYGVSQDDIAVTAGSMLARTTGGGRVSFLVATSWRGVITAFPLLADFCGESANSYSATSVRQTSRSSRNKGSGDFAPEGTSNGCTADEEFHPPGREVLRLGEITTGSKRLKVWRASAYGHYSLCSHQNFPNISGTF